MQSRTSFTPIDGHSRIGKDSFKGKQNLSAPPCFRQLEGSTIMSFLISNAFGSCLAIKAHTILVSTKTLQFPARRHSNLSPLSAVATISTPEIPLHHIVSTVPGEILSFGFYRRLSLSCKDNHASQSRKNQSFHVVIYFIIRTHEYTLCHHLYTAYLDYPKGIGQDRIVVRGK